jgi:hypothetical protein
MTTLKGKYYNIFLQEVTSIFIILAASLIPWMEFINNNYKELDNIFNDNFIFLILLYFFVIILIYFFSLYVFKEKSKMYHISLIGILIWIFFQYNLLKTVLNSLFTGFYIWHFSSELALFIVIAVIITITFLLNKNKNWRFFIIYFLIFNFIYSIITVIPKIKTFKINNDKINLKKQDTNQLNSDTTYKPNIYFFILDAMKPLNEFEDFYKVELNDFKSHYKKNNYIYYKNTSNMFEWTEPVMTGFFYLEENIYSADSTDKKEKFKPNINKTFPTILKNDYNPVLIEELNKLGYKFKWVGNYSQNCSKTNYRYCLNSEKKNYVDLYTLQAFLNKSPLVQIFDNIIQLNVVSNYFDLEILHSNAILEINNFVASNKKQINNTDPTFYFIHGVEAHAPYFVDSNCNNKRFVGRYNLEGYKNSYLCVIKKITTVIKTLDEFDPDSLVVFQSDHSWIMSTQSEKKYGNRNQIFNLIKNNTVCNEPIPENPNNINIANYIISCLKLKH